MNARSFIVLANVFASNDSGLDRRTQILTRGSFVSPNGFSPGEHARYSTEAGISVGLIYRYFQNKEACDFGHGQSHKQEIQEILERARRRRVTRIARVCSSRHTAAKPNRK